MEEKVEEYLRILYSDYDTLNKKENINFERKKTFITDNIEEIEKRYKQEVTEYKESEEIKEEKEIETNKEDEDIQIKSSEVDNENCSIILSKEKLNNIIKEIKIEKYFNLLHPEYETLNEEDKYFVLDDRMLIREYFDAIDTYYQDCKSPGSGAEEMNWTDQMIIQTALQLFNRQEKVFTPEDIEEFSNSVKYLEFKKAIATIKENSEEEQKEVINEQEDHK